ncbi:NFACT family protein [Clostridiaceae bacterium NSJ-31]|uniref:Rqc2 homolog RqcH n=3 Tax=Ligaoa zhengdingensis TaxID=2763658 RepID=A0A926DZV4_9FIRM|nr:NFACT RNA binding domain-containing protein [Ligaoa zhengdingensis]MBC8547181.1 NFACT family protein [Ligaoa zhengdingensis]
MALDGAFLSQLKYEIESAALESRVDRIHQPSREELVIALRWRGGGAKLLLSAGANSPRIHFTEVAIENPKQPPMFCMLLRKHLGNAKLVAVRQIGLDRILHLDFESVNEMGDLVTLTLAVEIMGRHSNIILIGPDGRVIDAIKRIDDEMSSVRQILPGMTYVLPPAQDKLVLTDCEPEQVLERLRAGRAVELSKGLMEALMGVSPILCRELAHYAARGRELLATELDGDAADRLAFRLRGLIETLRTHTGEPTMVSEPNGRPRDFSFIDIHQYGHLMVTRRCGSYSELLDRFYSERDGMERMKVRSHDLLRLLANNSDRVARKLAAQREELKECANRERFKIQGDLINANIYRLEKGMTYFDAENFYEEGSPTVRIPLDPQYPPAKNAQRYYAEYRKADTAEKMLHTLIAQGEEEALYLDSVFDSLARATTEAELAAIREELAAGGYIKNYKARNKKPEKVAPHRYRSSDGFTILSGRNNVQNDQLTLRQARGGDIWLHTQKIPGSHTIVFTEGRPVPDRTMTEAAIIAAWNSRARDSAQVAVDYTPARNVKKPRGAKPGMVVYDPYQTAYVTPDKELVERLEEH